MKKLGSKFNPVELQAPQFSCVILGIAILVVILTIAMACTVQYYSVLLFATLHKCTWSLPGKI
jgi:hypothetical protein